MATLKETFTNIADAIREKDGSTDKITPANMPQKIKNIPSGSSTNDYLQLKVNNHPSSGFWFYNFSTMTDDDLVDYLSGVSFAQATNMEYTFYQCSKLTTIPLIDTSKALAMNFMFYYCKNLVSVPFIETGNVDSMSNMFNYCSNITTVPLFNTSNVTNMSKMFYYCSKLTSIPAFNVSNCNNLKNMFDNCYKLKEIHMTGMKVAFNITPTALEHDAIVEVLNNLATVTSSPTLTMGSTKLALLSDAEKKIATDKGWTLA